MTYQKRFEKLTPEEQESISKKTVDAVIGYLEMFISPIIARRIICIILIIAGAQSKVVTQLTGLHERSIRGLKHRLVADDDMSDLFAVKSGRGRKSPIGDVKVQIVEEVEKGNYQTLQQIVDMVQEKFGIKTSISAVRRILKKTESAN